MPKSESALIALFHVRRRPLYCKQLRASLFGLSGWALEFFPPSPATAGHKGTSVANNTEVATVFFVSLRVSHKFFPCKLLFFHPLPVFRGPFFLFSAVPLSGPYWEDRQTLRPAKGLSASMVSFGRGQKRTDAAHTQQPPQPTPKTSPQTTDSHILPKLPFFCYLLSPSLFNDKTFISNFLPCIVQMVHCKPRPLQINAYLCLGCAYWKERHLVWANNELNTTVPHHL